MKLPCDWCGKKIKNRKPTFAGYQFTRGFPPDLIQEEVCMKCYKTILKKDLKRDKEILKQNTLHS